MKRKVAALLIAALIMAIFAPCAFAEGQTGELIWSHRLRDAGQWDKNISAPMPADDNILIVVGDRLVVLGEDGRERASVTLCATTDTGCRPALTDGGKAVVIPLHGGAMEKIMLSGLMPAWEIPAVSEKHQSLTPAVTDGKYVYYGASIASAQTTSDGVYRCVDAQDGSVVWEYSSPDAGFYWSAAAIADGCVVFGDDAGQLISLDAETGELIDALPLGAPIRSGAVYSAGSIYTVSNDGRMHAVAVENGRFKDAHSVRFAEYSTGTPVISDGCAYVGGRMGESEDWRGVCCIIDITDAADMTVLCTAYCPAEVKSTPLIAGGKAYFTANTPPGALYCADIAERGVKDAGLVYSPEGDGADYCIATPVLFGDTICYVNDSGLLFAVRLPADNAGITWLIVRAAVVIIVGCAAAWYIRRRRNAL